MLNSLALILAAVVAWQAPRPTKHYVSPKQCQFEFDYPADWVVSPAVGKDTCWVQLRPVDFAARMKKYDVDLHTLEVGRARGSFLQVVDEGFDFIDGKWVTLGRAGARTEAEVVSTPRWHGLKGAAATGCHHEGGGYAGLCEVPVLVLRDRDDDDLIWSMSGGPQTDEAFDLVLATFRFVKR